MELTPTFVEKLKDDTLLYIYHSNDRSKERPTISKHLFSRGFKFYNK